MVLIFWCLKSVTWTKSCLSGLGQNGLLAPVWLNPSWSESPKTPSHTPKQLWHPKNITQINWHPSRHPKTKKTQTDTNRHCQMSSNTPRQPSDTPKMHDRARLEPIPHFSKTVKGKNFVHLPFLRHQNIKTSLYAIYKNVWVLTFFLIFMSVREKLQFTVSFDHPVIGNFC